MRTMRRKARPSYERARPSAKNARMRYLFLGGFLALAAPACGGAVEDGASSSPSPVAAPGTNAPSSVTITGGCARSCHRMTETCAAYEDPRCEQNCASSFDTDAQAATFAACIDELSCEDIRRGIMMDYGPIGECWSRAHGR